jgi:PPOX class probable F420-dependent enzyme
MNSLDQFAKKSYLNLETFRKSGESMKTPVWFVEDGDLLYIRTMATSGKVKRIRHNVRVNVVPCRMDGKPRGTWAPAQARLVQDPEIAQKVDHLMDKKYGLLKKLFMHRGEGQGQGYTILEVKLLV